MSLVFTSLCKGLPFTESSKPTFSAQLKVQLDHFLSTQGEGRLPEGGRTLGSAADISKHLQRLQGRTSLHTALTASAKDA